MTQDEGCNECGLSFAAHGNEVDNECPATELYELRDDGSDVGQSKWFTIVGLRADGTRAMLSMSLKAARTLYDLLDCCPEVTGPEDK